MKVVTNKDLQIVVTELEYRIRLQQQEFQSKLELLESEMCRRMDDIYHAIKKAE